MFPAAVLSTSWELCIRTMGPTPGSFFPPHAMPATAGMNLTDMGVLWKKEKESKIGATCVTFSWKVTK